jgi:hypothetical protein
VTTRSTVLASGHGTVAGGGVVFTCPAGFNCLIKSAVVSNPTSSPGSVWYQLVSSTSQGQCWFGFGTVPAGEGLEWQGWIVMMPGDYLVLNYSQSETYWWINGAELPVGSQ